MLISDKEVIDLLKKFGIKISGVLHVGAHECEELDFYMKLDINEPIKGKTCFNF